MTELRPSTTEVSPEGSPKSAFRGDIQGLRAVAVILVMLWHAGWTALPGGYVGVDIFFVISGFLMTGLLRRELQAARRISIAGFYARRARRLVPASALLIASVGAMTLLLLPRARWGGIAGDMLASSGFAMNWRLAAQATDYLTATTGHPSPLQHFWSLGVEEQFYFLWPVLLLLCTWPARRARASAARGIWIAAGVVTVASLAASVIITHRSASQAYFVTTTRLWELAIGGAMALLIDQARRLPQTVAAALGWLGLGAGLGSAVFYTGSTSFPGTAALVPVLGSAAVIVTGTAARNRGPGLLLGLAPMRKVGDWSYSLYLWHWPLIVIATARFGELSQVEGLAVVAASFIPALVAYRFVEEAFRRSNATEQSNDSLQLGGLIQGACLALSLTFLALVPTAAPVQDFVVQAQPSSSAASGTEQPVGAQTLTDPVPLDPDGKVVDDPGDYFPPAGQRGRKSFGCNSSTTDPRMVTCELGDLNGSVHAVLVGDSHAQQWATAIDQVALARGWRVTMIAKDFCPYAPGVPILSGWYASCGPWQQQVTDYLRTQKPAFILTSQFDYLVQKTGDPVPVMAAGLRRTWSGLVAAGTGVVVLRNTPQPKIDMKECLISHPKQVSRCAVPQSSALSNLGAAQMRAATGLTGVTTVDLTQYICPRDPCAPIIGRVLVYSDANHMTYTYADTLVPRLAAALRRVGLKRSVTTPRSPSP